MHRIYFAIGALVVSAPVIARTIMVRRMRRRDPEAILRELRHLTCHVTEEAEMWDQDRDAKFWREIGGAKGMLALSRKACYLRDLVASLKIKEQDMDDMNFISQRCYWLIFLVAWQVVLSPLSIPHFPGRWAVGLYSEIRTRTLTLCRAYDRLLYANLRAIA